MMLRFTRPPCTLLAVLCTGTGAATAQVGEATDQISDGNPIIVTGERIRGGVDTDIPPVEELDVADVESLGASSVADVVAAVAPQSGSGRGRGGRPVILLNGQRISSFRELRDLPPEAIQRVQIFPEEVALKYGFRPDQRVLNFILKEGFSSFAGETDNGRPEDGGFWQNELEATFTSIGKTTRLVLDVEYERTGYLTRDERDIVPSDSELSFDFDGDINEFLTLAPATDRFEMNGTITRRFAPQTTLALNANYELLNSSTLLGLPAASLLLPGSSPFSPDGNDLTITRYFEAPRPLERDSVTHTANFGLSFNSLIGDWRWALTGDYGRIEQRSNTFRNADFTALQAALSAGTADPFAADFGDDLNFLPPDRANSVNQNLEFRSTLSGDLFALPAGPVQMTFAAGYSWQGQDSRSVVSGIETSAALRRNSYNGSVNLDIPLIERGLGPLGFLGDISINGNYGITEVSDFDRLTDYTTGIRWSPIRGVTLSASLIGDDNAPGIGQLGAPLVVTPNVSFFDFSRGETVLIDQITGGNPALLAEERRDLKIALNISPADRLNIQAEYFRNRSSNTTSAFPLLTPEIEAAFPGRVVRAADGSLVSVDQRPVNFARERSQSIRWGFNYSGNIRTGESRRGGERGRPQAGGNRRGGPPGARGGQRRAGGPGRGRPSRWRLSIYHTYQIQDEILIAPGVPVLDRLDGSATSFLGGTPRHRIELSGGAFHKGLGMFLSGNYRSATRADGSGLPGSSDLTFSDLATINLRTFINLEQRGKLAEKIPFFKGSRIAIRIDNLLGDIIDVRDENGLVPLSYQPGFLDPRGRFIEVSFRKRF